MTPQAAEHLNQRVLAAVNEAISLSYYSCDLSRQKSQVAELQRFEADLDMLRHHFIKIRHERNAGEVLRSLLLLEGTTHYLLVWINLKEDKPKDAWNSISEAQRSMRTAQTIRFDSEVKRVLGRFVETEALLFPPQKFLSPGLTYERSFCTICGKTYGVSTRCR